MALQYKYVGIRPYDVRFAQDRTAVSVTALTRASATCLSMTPVKNRVLPKYKSDEHLQHSDSHCAAVGLGVHACSQWCTMDVFKGL